MSDIFETGFIPSNPDERDYGLDKLNVSMAGQYPDEFVIKYLPDIYNQGNIGMCVGFSLAKIKESQEHKERGVKVRYSPAFIYANRDVRDYQGEGMMPRQALKQLSKYGTVDYDKFNLLEVYPVCKNELTLRINELLPLAISQRIKTYVRLTNNEEIMSFLIAEETPAMICVNLYENFYKHSNGVIDLPKGKNIGGHAMIVVGWKLINNKKHWIVSNSWDSNWGDNGYCYIPFDYKLMEIWGVVDRNVKDDTKMPQEISFIIDEKIIYTENNIINTDICSRIEDGRALIPARYLADVLGFDIHFEVLSDGRKVVTLKNGGELKK